MKEINEVTLIQSLFRSSKEERDKFWGKLAEMIEDAGMHPGFYHAYVPLRIVHSSNTAPTSTPVRFKTRYGTVEV